MESDDYTQLPDVTVHDLGFDAICEKLSDKEPEKRMILNIMSRMTPDSYVAKYRGEISSISSYLLFDIKDEI